MMERSIGVGIDDHKLSLSIAVRDEGGGKDPVIKKLANEDRALRRWWGPQTGSSGEAQEAQEKRSQGPPSRCSRTSPMTARDNVFSSFRMARASSRRSTGTEINNPPLV